MTGTRFHGNRFLGVLRPASQATLAMAVALASGLIAVQSAPAQTFTVLYNFTGGSDGGSPTAGLVRDAAGNLYGTTFLGGADGLGTVFKVNRGGKESVLHTFTGKGGDGELPIAGLIRDNADNLYGTTEGGGSASCSCGTVFMLNKRGQETVLYSFKGGSTDGAYPFGGVIRDNAGNLYGATYEGGTSGVGVVFRLTKNGKVTILHSFSGGSSDGAYPYYGSLLRSSPGTLYGTTQEGGASGYGVVFALSTSGKESILHSFTGGTTDGELPYAGLSRDRRGDFYGTTFEGGTSGYGVVFKLTKGGKESILHSFTGGTTDGELPYAGLIQDESGNFYGTTNEGGASGSGTIFEVSRSGSETVLYSFEYSADGGYPFAGLISDASGNLYGTTDAGGTYGGGTVFKFTPHLH